jgi:hypothetical protein
MHLKTEVADRLRGVSERSQPPKARQARSVVEEIDAFVMAHTTLEPGEFFRRLRQLDAWRALSASQSEGKGLCR